MAYVVVKGNIKIKYPGSIANEFNNDFYINVGPKLANAIDNSKITGSFSDYLADIDRSNSIDMYVLPTSVKEIINIVSKFQNKTSVDCCDIV